jgi:hypothetical protein
LRQHTINRQDIEEKETMSKQRRRRGSVEREYQQADGFGGVEATPLWSGVPVSASLPSTGEDAGGTQMRLFDMPLDMGTMAREEQERKAKRRGAGGGWVAVPPAGPLFEADADDDEETVNDLF